MRLVYDMSKSTSTTLRDEAGCMCPLGAFLVAVGVSPDSLVDLSGPDDLVDPEDSLDDFPEAAHWLFDLDESCGKWESSCDAEIIVEASMHLPDEEAQTEICQIFEAHGVEFVFDNFPVPLNALR